MTMQQTMQAYLRKATTTTAAPAAATAAVLAVGESECEAESSEDAATPEQLALLKAHLMRPKGGKVHTAVTFWRAMCGTWHDSSDPPSMQELLDIYNMKFTLPKVDKQNRRYNFNIQKVARHGLVDGDLYFFTKVLAVATSFAKANAWRMAKRPKMSEEENMKLNGGNSALERDALLRILREVEAFFPGGDVQLLISRDGVLADAALSIALSNGRVLIAIQAKVSQRGLNWEQFNFNHLHDKMGRAKYVGIAVLCIAVSKSDFSSSSPWERAWLAFDGSTIKMENFRFKNFPSEAEYKRRYGLDIDFSTPLAAIQYIVQSVRAEKNEFKPTTEMEVNWTFKSPTHAKEALGTQLFSHSFWPTKDPEGQNTAVDQIFSDMSLLPPGLRALIKGSLLQAKSACPYKVAYTCRRFGHHVGGGRMGRYSIKHFNASFFVHLIVSESAGIFSASAILWLITNEEFIENGCEDVFAENFKGEEKREASLSLHRFDRALGALPKRGHDWRWTRKMQLCLFSCGCGAARPGRIDDPVCLSCGAEKMTPRFEVPILPCDALPEAHLQRLLRQIVDHNESNKRKREEASSSGAGPSE